MRKARAGRGREGRERKQGTAVSVGAAMGALVQEMGIGRTLAQYDVITSWADVVGEQIARVAVPERLENGILFVRVARAPWRTELTMQRREIIEKLNKRARSTIVKDIRFR